MMATRNIELIETSVGCNWGTFCYECSEDFLCNTLSYARFVIDLALVDYKEK